MTIEELELLEKRVAEARDIRGSIHIVRERLTWLENGEPLSLGFDRGPSSWDEICLNEADMSFIRIQVEQVLRNRLAELQARLEAIPTTINPQEER